MLTFPLAAGALFADACLRGLDGQKGVVECTYVESDVVPGIPYFSSKVELGPHGVEKIHPIGKMNAYETQCLEAMKSELVSSIGKGVEFVKAA